MGEKKVTVMVIKVDLCCEKCKKKIKKILCKIPQIQNQIYDEKANTVTITVVCCSPEKIKKKICCKGGDCIIGIEIKDPEKLTPTPPEEPKPPKPKPPQSAPKPPEPVPAYPPLVVVCCMACYEGYGGGPCHHGYYSWGWAGYYGGCQRGCYVRRCDCLNEESPWACSVM